MVTRLRLFRKEGSAEGRVGGRKASLPSPLVAASSLVADIKNIFFAFAAAVMAWR